MNIKSDCAETAESAFVTTACFATTRVTTTCFTTTNSVGAGARLTENQLAIWIAQKTFPESPLYRITNYMRICGGVDIPVFQRAFQALINKSDILRTVFEECDGVPRQRVVDHLELDLKCIDYSQEPDPERCFQAFLSFHKNDVFDMNGVLYRSTLIKISPFKYIWYNDLHRLICDGDSVWECLRRMSIIYRRLRSRETLDDLVFTQFQDYLHSAEAYTGTERYRNEAEFWAAQSARSGKQVSYFGRTPSPSAAVTEVLRVERILETSLSTSMSTIASQLASNRKSGEAGRFLLLATLTAVFLQRLTDERDITLGMVWHNRHGKSAKAAIGPFSNVIPLTITIDVEDCFVDLLQKVAQVVRDGISHARTAPVTSVYHAVLNLHKDFITELADENGQKIAGFAGMPCKSFWLHSGRESNPLSIHMIGLEGADRCKLNFDWSTEIFQLGEAECLAEYFVVLLEGLVANPRCPLAELAFFSAAERDRFPQGWNNTAAGFSEPVSIVEAIEKRVEAAPESIALCYGNEQISYGELNKRANRLAYRLIGIGAGPEKTVAICVERSAHLVVGALAILKTGAAYVPLDPEYSQYHLNTICRDCSADILLLTENTRERVTGDRLIRIFMDIDPDGVAAVLADNPGVDISPLSTAYLIYAYGAAGRPGGVSMQHRGLAERVRRHSEAVALRAGDRTSQLAELSFDACAWEIWPTLVAGASLYIATDRERASPENLHSFLTGNRIDISFAPTVMIAWLLELDWSQNKSLRFLLTSGGGLSVGVPASLPFTLIDHYVPTENTLVNTFDAVEWPPKVVGAKTAVHSKTADGWLYGSGDSAPYLTDRVSVFAGERDRMQVCHQHIESRAIEAVIQAHRAVRRALVVSTRGVERGGATGDWELTAYITPEQSHLFEGAAGAEDLQKACTARWEAVYDRIYGADDSERISFGAAPSSRAALIDHSDPTFDIKAWNNSYTGLPMDPEQMRVWRDSTCERIRELTPRNLYEIGCGTGLLLFSLAPWCREYYATDISEQALRSIERRLPQVDMQQARVHLIKASADNADHMKRAKADTFVFNSVVQHFPDTDYLLRVIEAVVENTAIGGHLFIGDVRDLRFIEEFHAARALSGVMESALSGAMESALSGAMESALGGVVKSTIGGVVESDLSGAADLFDPPQLWRQVQQAVREEQELLLHPDFFMRLRDTMARVSDVDILLKQGACANELNQYRYDVIVHLDKKPGQLYPLEKWNRPLDLEALTRYLLSEAPGCLVIPAVPNTRVAPDIWLAQTLKEAATSGRRIRETLWEAAAIRRQYAELVSSPLVSPQDFWGLGEAIGYKVDISNHYSRDKGKYTVLLRRRNLPAAELPASRFFALAQGLTPVRAHTAKPAAYANNPLHRARLDNLIASIRSHCQHMLSDDMQPAHIVVMDELPVTADGEPDYRLLPKPGARWGTAKLETPVRPVSLEKAPSRVREEVFDFPAVRAEPVDN